MKKYNNRKHKTIGMTPTEASDPKNAIDVLSRLTDHTSTKITSRKAKPKFKVGDNVRISRQKDVFEKSDYNFSYEVFKINQVLDTDPITYKLVD